MANKKTKTILACICFFVCFFVFSNANAWIMVETPESQDFFVESMSYDAGNDDRLKLNFINNNESFYGIIFTSANNSNIFRYDVSSPDNRFFLRGFYCPDLSIQTITGANYWTGQSAYFLPPESETDCYVSKAYINYYFCGINLGRNITITNADGVRKDEIDNVSCSDALENHLKIDDIKYISQGIILAPATNFSNADWISSSANYLTAGEAEYFPFSSVVNGECGTADGGSFKTLPSELFPQLCLSGNAGNIVYNVYGWAWDCLSTTGGSTDTCFAFYDANAEAIDGECGTDDGQTLSAEPTNLCATGDAGQVYFINTGWNWTCYGVNNGTNDICSASFSDFGVPDLPAPENCDLLTGVEKWLCKIQNTFVGIFLPSQTAIDGLNNALQALKLRAPFVYIDHAKNNLDQFSAGQTESDGIQFAGDKSGTINFEMFGETGSVHNLMLFVQSISGFFILLIFLVWGMNFMKRFFK